MQVQAYMEVIILQYGQSALDGQAINFPFDLSEIAPPGEHSDQFVIIKVDGTNGELPKEYVADMTKVKRGTTLLENQQCSVFGYFYRSTIIGPLCHCSC